jgi:hypothetical protein
MRLRLSGAVVERAFVVRLGYGRVPDLSSEKFGSTAAGRAVSVAGSNELLIVRALARDRDLRVTAAEVLDVPLIVRHPGEGTQEREERAEREERGELQERE